MSDLMMGVKAHFNDRFGVLVEVQTPYSAEDLYTLYQATKTGAKVSILVRGVNKRAMRVDLRDLDADRTFGTIIVAAYANTSIPPPPGVPEEMAVYADRDTDPSESPPSVP